MTLMISLDCGCAISLISDGDAHRPDHLVPCPLHQMFALPLRGQLSGRRVRVKVIQDDAATVLQ